MTPVLRCRRRSPPGFRRLGPQGSEDLGPPRVQKTRSQVQKTGPHGPEDSVLRFRRTRIPQGSEDSDPPRFRNSVFWVQKTSFPQGSEDSFLQGSEDSVLRVHKTRFSGSEGSVLRFQKARPSGLEDSVLRVQKTRSSGSENSVPPPPHGFRRLVLQVQRLGPPGFSKTRSSGGFRRRGPSGFRRLVPPGSDNRPQKDRFQGSEGSVLRVHKARSSRFRRLGPQVQKTQLLQGSEDSSAGFRSSVLTGSEDSVLRVRRHRSSV
uniref:Uncharacterized protein n=1 Tax=Knipowitschia caucasica TaxID=637954 RepID=A0AAV2JJ41_KNICA